MPIPPFGSPPASDKNIKITDITDNDFSTSAHGFVPKGTDVGNFLKDDGTWAAAGGGSPGGADTQVQYNNSSAFGGDAGMTYNDATDTLTLGTALITPLIIGGTGVASDLTLRTTSGVGNTGDHIIFQGGNNGADELMRLTPDVGGLGYSSLLGIGTASPTRPIEISQDFEAQLRVSAYHASQGTVWFSRRAKGTEASPTGLAADNSIGFFGFHGYSTAAADFKYGSAFQALSDGTPTATTVPTRLVFKTSSSSVVLNEVMRLDQDTNVLFNTDGNVGTSAVGVIGIQNGTAPSSSPANMVQLFAVDISSSSELRVRDEAGNVTTLSPHPSDYLDTLPTDGDHECPYAYVSENKYIGKKISVDLEKLAKVVERLSGESLVQIEDIQKEDWDTNQNNYLSDNSSKITEVQEKIDYYKDELAKPGISKEYEDWLKEKLPLAESDLPEPYTKKTIPQWISRRLTK